MRYRLLSIFFFVSSLATTNAQHRDTLIRIAADPVHGFQYPYFLFIPATAQPHQVTYIFVETNNTGTANDTFAVHEEAARTQATRGPLGHYLSAQLHTPLLVPVFPRSKKKWKYYTHMLDRDVMSIRRGPMKRLDLQLVAMIESAREKLQQLGYPSEEKILMSGYSSSGIFANRFVVLHPELVKAYSAGGVNGLLMMPFSQWNGLALKYPLGTSDFKKITGTPFNFEAFKLVHQMLYMGDQDTNDAVLFDDGYSRKEREVIFAAFGMQMLPDRWFASQLQYKVATHLAQFRTYSDIGHQINDDILRDLVKFYTSVIKS